MNKKLIYGGISILILAGFAFFYLKNNTVHVANTTEKKDMTNTTEKTFEPIKKSENGDLVVVHYTGKLADGKVFDSSIQKGQPFGFILGKQMVIKGWDEGLLGVERGDKKTLVIAADKAYGDQEIKGGDGKVLIPKNSTLTFDIEVVEVVAKAKVDAMIAQQQAAQAAAQKDAAAATTKKQ